MNPLYVILLVAGAALVIFLIVKMAQAYAERERQRKLALSYWAAANGFTFSEGDPFNLDARYHGIGNIGTGHDRYALEVVFRQQPVPAAIFRYHYKTWETRTVTDSDGHSHTESYEETHWNRYLIVELGAAFPHFFIRPENLFDKIAGFVGFDDINFESEAFSKRYHCKSDDRQFAYALIHPQMMEYLQPLRFEGDLRNGRLVMDVSGVQHTADGCQQVWAQAAGFIDRIPPFVWQDYGKRDPVKLPEPVPYVAPSAEPSGGAARTV